MNIIVFVYLVVFSPIAVATTDGHGLVSLSFCAFLDYYVTVTRFLFGLASLPCEAQIVTSVLALTFVGLAGSLTGSMIHTSYVAKGQPVWPRYLLMLISICGWLVATHLAIILLGEQAPFGLIIPLAIVAGIITKRLIHKHSSPLVSSLLVLLYTVGWFGVIWMIETWWLFSVALQFCQFACHLLVSVSFCTFLDHYATVTRFLFGLASLPCDMHIVTSVLALTLVGLAGTLTGSMIHTFYVAKGQPVWPRYLLMLISMCGWLVVTLLAVNLLGKQAFFDLVVSLAIVAGIMTKRLIHKHSSFLVSSFLVLIYTVGWFGFILFPILDWWLIPVAIRFCAYGWWNCGAVGDWPL